MRYNSMMEDYPLYINHHPEETLTADHLGQVHSCKGEYLSYLFSCYYMENLDSYIRRVREEKRKNVDGVILPAKREITGKKISMRTKQMEAFTVMAYPVVIDEYSLYHPIEASVERYESQGESVALWWHDEEYQSQYMQGNMIKDSHDLEKKGELIAVPAGKYAVFSMEKTEDPELWKEQIKDMIHYAEKKWMIRNERKVNTQGYNFIFFKNNRVYYYLSLLEKEKEESIKTVYGVETWTNYIDENIMENISVASLATKFHYSPTHFKRVFKYYYKMPVADYIRKRKLTVIAEKIRQGEDYQETAIQYGFKTYAGFSRAFEKEFCMSPAAYKKGTFHVIDLSKYYGEYKDSLRLTIVKIKELKMIGQAILPASGDDVDIPAQINYWLGHEFPCIENARLEYNVAQREDKIALWDHNPENGAIEYLLGPVVEEFPEKLPESMVEITIKGGRYAIFETEKLSDQEDVPEVLRRYSRCVFFGWIKENRGLVDFTRITFERYVNGKIYLYVPLK